MREPGRRGPAGSQSNEHHGSLHQLRESKSLKPAVSAPSAAQDHPRRDALDCERSVLDPDGLATRSALEDTLEPAFQPNGPVVGRRPDGFGAFEDQTVERMPTVFDVTQDLELGDVDQDGDLDVVTSNLSSTPGVAVPVRWRVYLNDGAGWFAEATSDVFPNGVVGFGFDVEAADFNADGRSDLYLASRGSDDRLLLGIR